MPDSDRRRRDLARIHIAAKELGLLAPDGSDNGYRDVLFALTREHSAGELDFSSLQRVRAHLDQQVRAKGGKVPASAPKGMARDPMSRKVRALWLALADAGKVEDRSESALQAFVKRQTGIEHLKWCDSDAKGVVIEALKAWLKR